MLFVKNVKFISFLCTYLFSKNYNFKVIILICLLFLGVNFCFGVLHFLCLAKKIKILIHSIILIIYLMVLGISFLYTLIFWQTQLIIQHFMLCTSKPGTFLKFYHISLRKSFLPSCYVIELQTELNM